MKIKKIIFIVVSLIIAFVIGYFIYNIKRVNSSLFDIRDFRSKTYESSDSNLMLMFEESSITMKISDTFYFIVDYKLNENILILEHENKEYSFMIIDDNTFYYVTNNTYLYLKEIS
jgi:hypothetical protein